jgi:hypothetical protein
LDVVDALVPAPSAAVKKSKFAVSVVVRARPAASTTLVTRWLLSSGLTARDRLVFGAADNVCVADGYASRVTDDPGPPVEFYLLSAVTSPPEL